MATTPKTFPLLHRLLGLALVSLAAVILLLKYLGIAPILRHDSFALVTAYTLSGFGIVLAAVALFVLKPVVPARLPGQSVEQYWTMPEVGPKAFLVWTVLEGAGMVAAMGYLITGEFVCAIATVLAILAYWLCGPSVFAKA